MSLRLQSRKTILNVRPTSPTHNSSLCRAFLNRLERYTRLNYDLLLYWAQMHEDESAIALVCDDGFRIPEAGQAQYVSWEIEDTDRQNIFYLHGALHLFDAGSELKKFTWVNTGIRLIQQIRDALAANMFPLIVAEGTSEQEKEKIAHSGYLNRARRSFGSITGDLVVYGHSMSAADEHILAQLEHPKSKVTSIWISLYGNPESKAIGGSLNGLKEWCVYGKMQRGSLNPTILTPSPDPSGDKASFIHHIANGFATVCRRFEET